MFLGEVTPLHERSAALYPLVVKVKVLTDHNLHALLLGQGQGLHQAPGRVAAIVDLDLVADLVVGHDLGPAPCLDQGQAQDQGLDQGQSRDPGPGQILHPIHGQGLDPDPDLEAGHDLGVDQGPGVVRDHQVHTPKLGQDQRLLNLITKEAENQMLKAKAPQEVVIIWTVLALMLIRDTAS